MKGVIPALILVGLAGAWWMSRGSNESPVVFQPEPVSQQQGAPPEAETWSVVRVADGDTITARLGGREERIRFACIDAPESDQPLGAESGRRVQQLIDQAGGQVDLVVTDSDRYGRLIAEVYAGDNFAQEVLVSEGLAWSYRQFHANCPSAERINQVEAIAQQQKVGVFAGGHVEPWEWRQQ